MRQILRQFCSRLLLWFMDFELLSQLEVDGAPTPNTKIFSCNTMALSMPNNPFNLLADCMADNSNMLAATRLRISTIWMIPNLREIPA